MPNWDPVNPPRTVAAGDFEAAALHNDDRDRWFYLKGGAASDGTFLELAADATAGDSVITVVEVPEDIPADTVLHFRSGPNVWARTTQLTEASEDETEISVTPLPQNLEEGDVAPWPQQAVILIEAPLKVTPGIGAGLQWDKLLHVHDYTDESTLGTRWHHLGQKVAALTDNDYVDFIFGLKNTAGSEQLAAQIRFRRAGAATLSSVHISTNTGAGFPATPAIAIRPTNRIGINTTGPNYTVDIAGDLDLTGELIGIALWRETPPGTLKHTGSVEITGQFISTVATGTAPFTTSVTTTIRKLNVGTLEGHAGWLEDPVTDTGSDTVITPDTDYIIATATAPITALYDVEAECTADVNGTDVDQQFKATLKVGSTVVASKSGTLRLTTTRKGWFGVAAQVELTASDDVDLVVSKDDGGGSTPVAGSIVLTPIGAPA